MSDVVWVQRGTGRRVIVIEVRSQGPHAPAIVKYQFLDNGRYWSRVRPEFTAAFCREIGNATGSPVFPVPPASTARSRPR